MKAWRAAVWGLAVFAAGYGLLHINFRVRALQEEHDRLAAAVAAQQRDLHVLRAEWGARSSPARIEKLARRFLPELKPAGVVNFGSPDKPLRGDGPATEAAAGGRPPETGGKEI